MSQIYLTSYWVFCSYQITLEARVGMLWDSDIAIDDVSVTDNLQPCPKLVPPFDETLAGVWSSLFSHKASPDNPFSPNVGQVFVVGSGCISTFSSPQQTAHLIRDFVAGWTLDPICYGSEMPITHLATTLDPAVTTQVSNPDGNLRKNGEMDRLLKQI